jgi:hypothetical protein
MKSELAGPAAARPPTRSPPALPLAALHDEHSAAPDEAEQRLDGEAV